MGAQERGNRICCSEEGGREAQEEVALRQACSLLQILGAEAVDICGALHHKARKANHS